MYRNHYTAGWDYTVCGCKSRKNKDRAGDLAAALLFWGNLYCSDVGILYSGPVIMAAGTVGIRIKKQDLPVAAGAKASEFCIQMPFFVANILSV